MKRVLIWGGDSWANQGDSAILSATLAALRETMPEAELLVASSRPKETATLHQVKSINRTPGGILGALACCDLLVWGGGQLLQNASSKPFLFLQFILLAAAKLMGKKVICYGQGVGPVTGFVSRSLARRMVGALDAIALRDEHSFREITSLGISSKSICLTADPAIALEAAPEQRAQAILSEEDIRRPFVAISLRRWGHYNSNWLPVSFYARGRRWPAGHLEMFQGFQLEMAKLSDHIISALGAQVVFLPMSPGGDQGDEAIAEEVVGMMHNRQSARVVKGRYHPAELKALLAEADLIVGLRMHPLILACSAGTPGIAISYAGKGESFLASLGLSRYSVPFELATFSTLRPLVEKAWLEKAHLSQLLAERIPALKQAALINAQMARDLMYQQKEGRGQTKAPQHGSKDINAPGFSPWHPKESNATTQQFDREAESWAGLYEKGVLSRPFISASLKARMMTLLELAEAKPGQVVIDLGCGPGVYAQDLLAGGRLWIGVDISRAMVAQAALNTSGRTSAFLLQGSGLALPLGDERVDVAVCSGVVDYIKGEELEQLLRELCRVLRVDGALCITANSPDPLRWLRSRLPSWLPSPLKVVGPAYFHSGRLPRLLFKAGLKVEQTIKLSSRPMGGTVVFKARRITVPISAVEPAGASGKLL